MMHHRMAMFLKEIPVSLYVAFDLFILNFTNAWLKVYQFSVNLCTFLRFCKITFPLEIAIMVRKNIFKNKDYQNATFSCIIEIMSKCFDMFIKFGS